MADMYVYVELEEALLEERRGVWDEIGVVEES